MEGIYSCRFCCKIIEERKIKRKLQDIKRKKIQNIFCNLSCSSKFFWKTKKENKIKKYMLNPLTCKECNTAIPYKKAKTKLVDLRYKKIINIFCNHKCAATYNNTHKTKGNRKSKLEFYLEKELPLLYPNLEFHFNRKDTINSELDIYIPSMKLAFELNGIFHYEPIYGEAKLDQIQNNDKRKFQACLERGIELCIIDSSKLVYFKESKAKPYLDIMINIINSKLLGQDLNLEPSRYIYPQVFISCGMDFVFIP